jgi:hypothetical protein
VKHSDSIQELAQALSKAQGAMGAAHKDAQNPHLRNTYASLSSIIDTAKGPLSANGLAFVQLLCQAESGGMILETVLMHSSGQWLSSEILVNATAANKGVNEAQALGSALTYYKRYALAALLGISVADEDDDGNSSGQSARKQPERRPQVNVETGEVTQPKPDSRPVAPVKSDQPQAETKKANGNGHKQLNPEKLLAEVNSKTGDFYATLGDLYKALGGWPNFKDGDSIEAALSIAVDYANEMKPVQA